MTHRIRTTAPAAMIVFLLAACTTPPPTPPTATPPPSPTPTLVTVGHIYPNTNTLRQDIETRTSVHCTTYALIPTPKNALERADCTDAITLAIYTDKDSGRNAITHTNQLVATLHEEGDRTYDVLGQNWSVGFGDTGETQATEIAQALNGELIVTEYS